MIEFCLTSVVAFFTLFFIVVAKFHKQEVLTPAKLPKHFHAIPAH